MKIIERPLLWHWVRTAVRAEKVGDHDRLTAGEVRLRLVERQTRNHGHVWVHDRKRCVSRALEQIARVHFVEDGLELRSDFGSRSLKAHGYASRLAARGCAQAGHAELQCSIRHPQHARAVSLRSRIRERRRPIQPLLRRKRAVGILTVVSVDHGRDGMRRVALTTHDTPPTTDSDTLAAVGCSTATALKGLGLGISLAALFPCRIISQ
jgi:hypothetical protein